MQNTGYIHELPHEEDYILSGNTKIKGTPILESGDWRPYFPQMEVQRNNVFDTYSCVSFAACNAIEMLHKKLYNEEVNFSDRFVSVMSGTTPGKGNSLRAVQESIRKNGLVLETEYPFTPTMTQNEFFQKVTQDIKDLGIKWLETVNYGWEWSQTGRFSPTMILDALKYSPLPTAVDAETTSATDFQNYNHSIAIVNAEKDVGIDTYDSYLGRNFRYPWNYPFYSPVKVTYSKIIQLIVNDMKFTLIRDKATGKIYLLDSDGKKHWIKTPSIFTDYFGKKAWLEGDWLDTDTSQYADGKEFNDSVGLVDALKQLIAIFGIKK